MADSVTAPAPDIEITAGDYYVETVIIKDVDYSGKTVAAQVRRGESKDSELIGDFVIDSKVYAAPNTTVTMSLGPVITRKIAAVREAYWDFQVQLEAGTTKPITLIRGRYLGVPDVTE